MTPQWPHNSFTKRFHLDFPLLLAPMAGFTTPELVSSISCAGGLGSLGAAHMSPKELRSAIEALRLKTHKPFIVNLYAASPTAASEQSIKAQVALNPYRKKLGLPGRFECLRPAYTFEDQLDVLIEEKIPIFSFSLGCISKSQRQRLEKAGIAVFGTATQLKEVKHLNQLRVDAIILQGEEAGGPRSTFLTPCREGLVSLLDLIPQAKEVSSLPLIAAGGIIHAKQIAAALILGADAVQMGTAFAICAESGAPACFKEAFKKIQAEIVNPETKLTDASVDAIKNQLLQVKRAMNPREVDEATGIVRGKPVSFQGLENLRRMLGDRARGLPAEGFDAIGQQQAGRLE
ncbi:MAG: nitronate monooxygenase, partial [Chlamydiae bacterium]|nr:nitronate monooxygenase [Chlamydiota bacterium]